jgi:hypothetical protein
LIDLHGVHVFQGVIVLLLMHCLLERQLSTNEFCDCFLFNHEEHEGHEGGVCDGFCFVPLHVLHALHGFKFFSRNCIAARISDTLFLSQAYIVLP